MSDDELRALITPEMLEEGERTMAELRRVMDSLSEDTGQTAYSSLMEPCPFCGGTAWLQYWEYPSGGGMEGRAVCGGCHVSTSRDFQGARTTYLPTGEDITKPLLIKQVIETWNRRVERTCRDIDHMQGAIKCSECGEITPSTLYWVESGDGFMTVKGHRPRFCSNCGARVVDS